MAKIQLRSDTLANWLTVDPILLHGEKVLVATDPEKPDVYDRECVGDGVRKFSELPFLYEDIFKTIRLHVNALEQRIQVLEESLTNKAEVKDCVLIISGNVVNNTLILKKGSVSDGVLVLN